jgi:HSP20 family protein
MVARRVFDFPFMGWRNPLAGMERMARQMDILTNAMLGRPEMRMFPARVFPAINITEDKDKYYVRAELPGMKADEVRLEVAGRNLSISGERNIPSEGENVRYHRREREAGTFSRIIGLPGDMDADSVNARLVNGLLTVAIAKSEVAKPKQISVK